MKKCFICGKEKDIDDFYVHPKMGDGHLNKCKECTKRYSKERDHKLRESDEYAEKERVRAKEKYYRLNYRERQYELSKGKPYKGAKYKNLHRNLGLKEDQSGHHWNYNEVSDIIILSKRDHRFIHRFLRLNHESLIFNTIDGKVLDTRKKHIEYINNLLLNRR